MPSTEGVSIIIPNWNHEYFLPRSISSALSALQAIRTHGMDGEVLVVDDHSRDGSTTLLRQLEALHYGDGLSICLLDANQGLGHARNKGLQLAKNRYVVLLDADNELIPGNLHLFIRAIRETQASIVFGNLVTVSGEETGVRGNRPFDMGMFGRNHIDACALADREKLVQMGGYVTDPRLFGYEDWEMSLHLASNGRKVVYVPEDFGRYYRIPGSMIRDEDVRHGQTLKRINRIFNQVGIRKSMPIRTAGLSYHPDKGYL
jgi:glycosyltransferase involved in cell wall biosynthesis